MLSGSMPALVTPFKDGKVDEESLRGLVAWHIEQGTNVLVPCGTTGEAACLSEAEFDLVVSTVVKAAAGKIPVVAGTGSNNTRVAVERTKRAKALKADASLVVTPYYNKPTQEGLYQHYKAIVDGAKLPLVLYNVPGRTAGNMLPDTVARLAQFPEIIAIKEASGSLDQISEVFAKAGENIDVLSGDDALNFHIAALGGKGFVSVLANIAPAAVAELYQLFEGGKLAEARAHHARYLPLIRALFLETNPIPVKTALVMMGKVAEEFRLPMCEISADNRTKLREVLTRYDLIAS